MLSGFIDEARGYLPRILAGIETFHAHPHQGEALEEAHRLAHTIKGAASMVGLNGLSLIAGQLEEILEGLMTAAQVPPSDETAALLCQIVMQIQLYLEGKASGTLRERPLLDETNRIYHQLRSLPLEDRPEAPLLDNPGAEFAERTARNLLQARIRELRKSLREAVGTEGCTASVRLSFEAIQAEAFRQGQTELADALQRLGLMTEVWECLAAEGPETAQSVADFCDHAFDYLLRAGEESEPDLDVAWILQDSADRWGEYLALLDPGQLDAQTGDRFDAFRDLDPSEGAPALDTGNLLRLLTGQPVVPPPHAEPVAICSDPTAGPGSLADAEVSSELREIFALEAEDHLHELSRLLPLLAAQPGDRELLQDIRRSAHTLKGSAAMVGYGAITQLAHRMEDLLDLLYEGSRAVTPELIGLLQASTDALDDLVSGKTAQDTLGALYAQYETLLGSEPIAAPVREGLADSSGQVSLVVAGAAADHGAEPDHPEPSRATRAATLEERRRIQFVRVPIGRLDDLVKLLGEMVITRTFLEQRLADVSRQVAELERSSSRLRQVSSRLETEYEASTLGSSRPFLLPPSRELGNGNGGHHGNGHPNRLGHAELHGPKNQPHGFDDLELDRYTEFHLLSRSLSETTSDIQTVAGELASLTGDLDGYLNRQARLAGEVENKLMRSRMVPFATLATRLHRAVRNVANQRGKLAELIITGESTELDKTMLEEMADPLLHLLRNAVDHGIESPDLREAVGKPAQGQIRLRAAYEGSQVVLQISDDGAGLDAGLVRSVAVSRGFVAPGDAARMSDAEISALVYLAGFSTAQQISEISGRGVGLDIVKASVHKLKGSLEFDSQPGKGTAFTIRLPMTMAILRSILVKTHQETFAIPLSAVRQIMRLDPSEIECLGRDRVVRVSGKLYPLFALGKVLNLRQPPDESVARRPVLVLESGSSQVAIMVDHLVGGREVVIKNLGSHLRRVRNVMGATLMGDGSVVLILEPQELVREAIESAGCVRPQAPASAASARDTWSILLVDDSPSVRRVLSNLIKNAGWKPITAKDGLDALETLQHTTAQPDLILLDVEMPRMDGYEFLLALKSQEAYRAIPVVMITSRAGEKHRRRALDLGCSGYVVKPYQDDALLKIISHLVRESRSQQAIHV